MNTPQKLYNVGMYVRLSRNDELSDSQSIESQQQILSKFISMMPGWIEQKTYIDNGYSGGNYNRPAFQELMNDIRTGKINLLLVKDLSRLGRNYLETGKYLEEELQIRGSDGQCGYRERRE
jgi:DNA invertase Pin-like site-specific DNA recombinase